MFHLLRDRHHCAPFKIPVEPWRQLRKQPIYTACDCIHYLRSTHCNQLYNQLNHLKSPKSYLFCHLGSWFRLRMERQVSIPHDSPQLDGPFRFNEYHCLVLGQRLNNSRNISKIKRCINTR